MNDVVVASGGQATCDLFVVKLKADKSGFDVYDIYTGAPAVVSSPTRTTAKPLTLTEITKTKPQFQDDGTVKLDFDNYDSSGDFWKFLDTVAVPPAESTGKLPDYKLENGVQRSSASASGYMVLAISYLHKNTAKTPNEVFIIAALGSVSPTSGSFETNPEDQTKPSFSFVGSKAEAALDIPPALFYSHASDASAGILDTEEVAALAAASGLKIVKGGCYIRKYIPVPHAA